MRLILGLVCLLAARAAGADPCAPTVVLGGAGAGEIGELLAARGIAVAAEPPERCPAVRATVTQDAGGLAVAIAIVELDGTQVSRVAPEARTAATVIESFVRADVGAPLLASREAPRAREEAVVVLSSPPPPNVARRGVHVFGAFETSYANDGTGWLGGHVGACVMLGPVCPAARVRFASVARTPEDFDAERRSVELLVGLDIPFAVGGAVLSPGFAAGLGQMHTRGATHAMRSETGGMRADVHATLSFPFSKKLAFDVFAAADLTQQTDVEWGPEMVPLPAEPRVLVRLGLGVHYGGL